MTKQQKETVFILTKADRDRIEAGIRLLRQVIREIIANRRIRVDGDAHTPGSLSELADQAEKAHAAMSKSRTSSARSREEQLQFNGF